MRALCVDLLLALLAAHFLGDFVFQARWMVERKRSFSVLGVHALCHGVLAYLLVGWWSVGWIAAVVLVTHGAIDFVKARVAAGKTGVFLADQAAHLSVIVALAFLGGGPWDRTFWTGLWGWEYDRCLVFVVGGVFCVRTSGILIGYWVQPYLDEIQRTKSSGALAAAGARGLTMGGRVIGQWERALIFMFVGVGLPSGIGFLIAAKSIFRFGELKDRENRMEAEYITIGTLMSFAMAIASSYATLWLARG